VIERHITTFFFILFLQLHQNILKGFASPAFFAGFRNYKKLKMFVFHLMLTATQIVTAFTLLLLSECNAHWVQKVILNIFGLFQYFRNSNSSRDIRLFFWKFHQNFENSLSPPFFGFQRLEKAQNVRLELLFQLVLTATRLNIYREFKKQLNLKLTLCQF